MACRRAWQAGFGGFRRDLLPPRRKPRRGSGIQPGAHSRRAILRHRSRSRTRTPICRTWFPRRADSPSCSGAWVSRTHRGSCSTTRRAVLGRAWLVADGAVRTRRGRRAGWRAAEMGGRGPAYRKRRAGARQPRPVRPHLPRHPDCAASGTCCDNLRGWARTRAGRPRRRRGSPAPSRRCGRACEAATSQARATCPTRICSIRDQTMLPAEALRARFAREGADGSQPVVTSCGSGVTRLHADARPCRRGPPGGAVYDGPGPSGAAGRIRSSEQRPRAEQMPADRGPHRSRASVPACRMSVAPGRACTGSSIRRVLRGSTVLYPTMADRRAAHDEAIRAGARLRRDGRPRPITRWRM